MNPKSIGEPIVLEEQLNEAIIQNDGDEIGRMLADDWVLIGPDGAIVDRRDSSR